MKFSESSRPKLYLVDGHALCYRAFYAVQGLTNSKGVPTNAVFGFVNILRKILREHKPDYMAVCFDAKVKTHRQEKFAAYKIHRKPMPDELRPQIDLIRQVVEAFHIPVVLENGYEADDTLASLVRLFKARTDVVIVTDDKDIFQIVDPQVKVFSPRKEAILGAEDVKDLWGVGPEFIVDMIGLAGDASDNIPGVEGVGKVTAAKLINQYGHLEDIYRALDGMKPSKVKENLARDRDQAFLSRDLAVLDANAPVPTDLQQLKRREPDNRRLYEIFQDLEFRGFLKDYAPSDQPDPVPVLAPAPAVELKKDTAELLKAVADSAELMWLFDPQSTDMFASVWMSPGDQRVWNIPRTDLIRIRQLFENASWAHTVYDLKSSLKLLDDQAISLAGQAFDVMLAGYALGEPAGMLGYDDLIWKYLHQTPAVDDADRVGRMAVLKTSLQKELKDKQLEALLFDIEQPLSHVLFEMERQGVAIDKELLKELSDACAAKMAVIEKDLYAAAGEPFNLNSPKQLATILFEKLQLPVVKKTKTGYSTDEEVLTQLAQDHPLPSMILEYRQYAKLKSTYIDALPGLTSPKTGRIHTEFLQVGAETGRLSSRHPNLQNIPIRTELGRKIRGAFVSSEKDWLLVSADYSQIELRVLAHLSGDENLTRAFLDGQDIHTYTASQIFDVPDKEIDYAMRDTAKRVNFGIIYGMSAFGLSKDLNISVGQAKVFIDKYFSRYPGVKRFMDQCVKDCEEKGFVSTIFNRRRYLPDIHNKNAAIRQFAQRQAINTPVQGSAADLIKLAMIRVQDALKAGGMKTRMIITVHDELVFESPEKEIAPLAKLLKEHMENALKLSVPVRINIKTGANWLEMKNL